MSRIKHILNKLSPVLSVLFWLLMWLLIALLLEKPLLLPTPWAVLKKLCALALTGEFWLNIGASLARILAGFLSALVLGVALAALTVRSRLAAHVATPLLGVLKTTPVVAVIFLLLLWLGRDTVPAAIAFAMALPIVWSNAVAGFAATDPKLLEMARVFAVPKKRIFREIRLPAARGALFAACRASVGLSFKAGVAAEVLAIPRHSIGGAIFESNLYLYTDELFAYTLSVILFGALIEFAVLKLLPEERK